MNYINYARWDHYSDDETVTLTRLNYDLLVAELRQAQQELTEYKRRDSGTA